MQERIVQSLLAGSDVAVIMPTGGGKSLCYQLPALALGQTVVVVSPLIALMQDQVAQLGDMGIPAAVLNSSQPADEQRAVMRAAAQGAFRLLYLSPERLARADTIDWLRKLPLAFFAIDEAHCISEWGHDFRLDYSRLGYFRRLLGNPTTIALTATATDRVRRDIVDQLALNDPATFITGFARPNLFYEVQTPRGERQKPEMLVEFLHRTPGSGIIYASTRKRTEEVAEIIASGCKRSVAVYHAGLLPEQRRKAQDDFMQGRSEIVVATNAFGMGIDKADVRFVIHYNIPGSVEAYYQEAGRAGRDGALSHCMMIYHPSDRYIQEYFIETTYPDRANVEAVYDFLCKRDENPIEMTQDELKQTLSLPIGADGVGNCEQLLESAGVLERLIASQNLATVRIDSDLPTLVDLLPKQAKTQRKVMQSVERIVGARRQELVQFNFRELSVNDEFDQTSIAHALRELNKLEAFTYVPPFRGRAIRMIRRDLSFEELEIDFEAIERRKAAEYEKLEQVIRFAQGYSCRQRQILQYFGEENAKPCGHCDNCRLRGVVNSPLLPGEGQGVRADATVSPRPLGEVPGVRADDKNSPRPLAGDCPKFRVSENGTVPFSDVGQHDALTLTLSQRERGPEIEEKVLEAIRMVLSGVARTKKRFSCGRNLIALMLCGSGSAKVKKLGLNKLSTFGLLKHLKQEEVGLMIDALVRLKCLQQVDVERNRPVIELTEYGSEVMRGKASLAGPFPVPAEVLWKLRWGLKGEGARDRGQGSEFRVQDKTARRQGEGESGRREEAESTVLSRSPDLPISQSPNLPLSSPPPSHYWTRRLLSAGFSVDECMAIRGLSREAVLEHARLAEREAQ
jgi:ATP-dependent DNA helicase RecQ